MRLRSLLFSSAVYSGTEGGGSPTATPAVPAPPNPAATVPAADTNGALAGALLTPPADPATPDPDKPAQPAKPEPPKELKPEDYKLAEGTLPKEIDPADPMLTDFLGAAAKLGLPNEAVNAVLAAVAPKIAAELAKPLQAYNELKTAWETEVRADPVIGGANYDKTVTRISQGIQQFMTTPGADPATRKAEIQAIAKALDVTGAGSNPALLRGLNRVFSRLSEGTPVVGSPAGTKGPDLAGLYNNPTSNIRTAAPG